MTQRSNMSAVSQREQRVVNNSQIEVRAKADGSPQIVGYAAVFDQPSNVIDDWLGGFVEYCSQGCFTKTLADGADVRALYNHDSNFVIGRTKSGTLRCSEDAHGLHYEVDPPPTQWARDLMETMRRGDVSQSSFAFRTIRDRWGTTVGTDGDKLDSRTLLECQLYDVSPVAFPAYPQTDSAVRSILQDIGLGGDRFLRVASRLQRGLTVTDEDRGLLKKVIGTLTDYLDATPENDPIPTQTPPPMVVPEPTPPEPPAPPEPIVVRATPKSITKYLERLAKLEKLTA